MSGGAADPADGAPPDGEGPERDDASSEQDADSDEASESVFDRYQQLTPGRLVAAITVVAVVVRLVTLGERPAHWDEARVAYWAHFYEDTGSLAYYWEEHGPFAQLAAGNLFDMFGANDFTARLPVALVGGLLPAGALLYREHLDRIETVALALLLAGNTVLIYYSRFLRSDVLVATFMFVALGCLVRFWDTRRARYVLGAGVFLGLGFGSKENAVIYLLTWAGAAALLVDQFLHSPASDQSGLSYLRANLGAYWDRVKQAAYRADYAIGLALTFVVTLVVLFAPRGQGLDRRLDPATDADPVTLGDTLTDPTNVMTLVDESLNEAYSGYIDWFAQSEETTLDTYVSFLGDYVTLLVKYAPLLTVFTLVGIAVERYARGRSRPLVMFMAYCGIASLVGYPLGSHIEGDSAWLSVHVIIPLLVPAAVGLAWAWRQGRDTVRKSSVSPAAVVVVLILLVGLWAWFIPVQSVYVDDTAPENDLVQFAQPYSDLDPLVEKMDGVSDDHSGTDVLIYYGERGESFDSYGSLLPSTLPADTTGMWQVAPVCSSWGSTQPLNWYFATTGTDADCERSPDGLVESASTDAVPIIVTIPGDETVPEATLDESYEKQTYYLRSLGRETTVYVHDSYADT
ncbi:TIGR03663 family protein [Halovenus aranensis]|uniref:TIGR03663 family protein n=1 Tax=Halovenus aranensis TaxID=890420 RepID=A0A1G8U3N7_9EURY|nr:flippase activity-associated protein Agl23 [Halovenus aranensis]SDJ48234.1 TIGR03663 family protein [Halovenus aranensis]